MRGPEDDRPEWVREATEDEREDAANWAAQENVT